MASDSLLAPNYTLFLPYPRKHSVNRAHSVKASMTAVYSLMRPVVLIILVATRVFRAYSMG